MEGETNNLNNTNIPENPNIPTENGSSIGPIVGTIVILLIIVLGAFYFWGERKSSTPNVDNTVQDIKMQDKSDDTSSIEADLQSTDVESVDAQLNAS